MSVTLLSRDAVRLAGPAMTSPNSRQLMDTAIRYHMPEMPPACAFDAVPTTDDPPIQLDIHSAQMGSTPRLLLPSRKVSASCCFLPDR